MLRLTDYRGQDVGFQDIDVEVEKQIVAFFDERGETNSVRYETIAKAIDYPIDVDCYDALRRLDMIVRFSDSLTVYVARQKSHATPTPRKRCARIPEEEVQERRQEKQRVACGKAVIEHVLSEAEDVKCGSHHWLLDGHHEFDVHYNESKHSYSLSFYGEHVRVNVSNKSVDELLNIARHAAVLEAQIEESE